jgi:phage tail sheath protein FI
MAERIVSPGVFTNEKDLSFLPAGIAAIGAAIIGPTTKGPAFVPTVVTSFDDFIAKFGGLSEETYVPYAVKSYLNSASTVTVVRVLSEGGYNADAVQIVHTNGATSRLVGVIMPTTTVGSSTGNGFTKSDFAAFQAGSVTGSFGFQLSGSSVTAQALTASANPSNVNSFANVLGTSVKGSKKGYMYTWFSDYLATSTGLSGSVSFVSQSANTKVDLSGSAGVYSNAETPWIQSQIIGAEKLNLFKIHTLADGTDTNTSFKVAVINTTLPGDDAGSDYGSFTVVVRDYNDTDQRPVILESFTGLNLDPDSSNYIARRIGDKAYSVSSAGVVSVTGDYNNISKYIRVEVDSAVSAKAITANVKPFGFAAVVQPVSSSYAMPTASMVTQNTEINSAYNKKAYYGWNWSSTDNSNYLKPLALGASAMNNAAFNLDACFIHASASKLNDSSTFVGGSSVSASVFAGLDVSTFLKFTVPFQGGFDGMDPAITKKVGSAITATNLFGMDCSTATAKGSVGYVKALNVISNSDEYDVNLIVTPGATIKDHSTIVNKAIEVAEDRGDAFVIADPVIQGQSAAAAIAAVTDSGIDSNYVGTYWPWVKILDTDKNKPVWVPPSVVVPRVMAYNDSVAYEWFAPAGLNRGGISEAVDVELKLNQADRNDLYENKINAIATFPNQGICIWGQKTLQAKPSALDRINVRRLMITMKKYIASASRYLVFENNTTATRQRFLNIVTPYLETVKARQGLYAFKVVMDETNNTPDVIDRNIMYGQIYLQPAKAAEFIVLDFNILPTGATFDNA